MTGGERRARRVVDQAEVRDAGLVAEQPGGRHGLPNLGDEFLPGG